MSSEKGQNLIELIVVVAITVLIVGVLVVATISGIRNANLANNQVQATKLAQEGIEKVKALRDQDGAVGFDDGTNRADIFSDLWGISFDCNISNCYFKLNSLGGLTGVNTVTEKEVIPGGIFKRQILIEGSGNYKTITSIVTWKDYSGEHESRLTTYLGKK